MNKEIHKEQIKTRQQHEATKEHELILINDDLHSFDYVIDTLVLVCKHTYEQAAQCTMITHYKGECEVKIGRLNELRPLRKALVDRELRAKIN